MNTPDITRRHFFQDCGIGTGKIALASLLAESAYGVTARVRMSPAAIAFSSRRRRRSSTCSWPERRRSLEMFDNKPMLTKYEGKPLPPSIIGGQRYAFIRPDAAVLGPRFKFAKHGQCGAELSESAAASRHDR